VCVCVCVCVRACARAFESEQKDGVGVYERLRVSQYDST